jgi:ferredoxin
MVTTPFPHNLRPWEVVLKVRADHTLCAGHAQCNATAPELFTLDDDGYVAIDEIDVPAGSEDLARRGVAACPERALQIG